jgi:diguanylate cyclase (GGDEF)-like protein
LILIVVVTVVMVPLATTALHQSPLVLPGAFVATIAFNVVSLVLVWQQFQRTGNRRYLVIAAAFVFAVVDQTFWMLSAPGLVAVSDVGVFGVEGGPVYVGAWWAIYSLVVAVGIARWPRAWQSGVPLPRRLGLARGVLLSALVASLLWMAVALYVVPLVLKPDDFRGLVLMSEAIAIPLAATALVVALTGRHDELLLRWALVVPVTALCIEVLYLTGVERYSLGWFGAKTLTVVGSGILAVVLLVDNAASYRRAVDAAAQSEQLLGRALAAAGAPVALVRRMESGDWRVEFAGESAQGHLGAEHRVTPESTIPAPAQLRALLEDAAWRGRAETVFVAPDGSELPCTAVAVGNSRIVVTWRPESPAQRVGAVQAAVRATDAVTGLPNRDSFLAIVAAGLAGGQPVLLAYLDLDGYAAINDRYGYVLGDGLLAEVGHRLSQVVGPTGTTARLGSDDFAVAFLVDTSVSAAEAALRGALAEPLALGGERILVSATHGYAVSEPGVDAERLVAQARDAMLTARQQGRGSSAVHDPSRPTPPGQADITRQEFVTALESGQFELQYQPIWWQRSNALWGHESLVTWNHPRLGRLAPGSYLPEAERWGLTAALGQWVTRSACTTAASSSRLVTFNLGAADLSRPGLCAAVMNEVRRSGCDPAKLIIELTESALLHAGSAAVANVLELHDEGIRVALDDFGTGFAALGYLSWLPLDVIKVDRGVIDPRIAEPPQPLLTAVVDLAHSIGALALAEGVENQATAARIKRAGFDLVQGFHYGRPGPLPVADRFAALSAGRESAGAGKATATQPRQI